MATSVLATGSTIGEDGAGVAGKSSDRSSSSASRPGMPTGTEDRSVERNGVGTTISGDRAHAAVGATNSGLSFERRWIDGDAFNGEAEGGVGCTGDCTRDGEAGCEGGGDRAGGGLGGGLGIGPEQAWNERRVLERERLGAVAMEGRERSKITSITALHRVRLAYWDCMICFSDRSQSWKSMA